MKPDRYLELTISKRQLVLALCLGLDALFAMTLLLPGVWAEVGIRNSVLFGLAIFVGWQCALLVFSAKHQVPLAVCWHVRKVHVVQSCFQLCAMLYWGLYWPPVYHNLYMILIQLVFAYLFESGLEWTMGRSFRIGFAQFPVVLSMNLFLWFDHRYFFLQFALIAVGLTSKALLTWNRDGIRTHIFNPSALPLACAALVLILLEPTDIAGGTGFSASWGISSGIFQALFLISLLGNIWFPRVLLTGSIVVTLVAVHLLSIQFFGQPFFVLPISPPVFLGAVLLVTDPATSPRTRGGLVLFGICYALLVNVFLWLLYSHDLPGYYDKVLAVPVVNLLVPIFDRAGNALGAALRVRLGAAAALARSHILHLAVWSAFFIFATPVLLEPRAPLQQPPGWCRPSPEIMEAKIAMARRCSKRPQSCGPFGLFNELLDFLK